MSLKYAHYDNKTTLVAFVRGFPVAYIRPTYYFDTNPWISGRVFHYSCDTAAPLCLTGVRCMP